MQNNYNSIQNLKLYEHLMRKVLFLAKKGQGKVLANPLVGAIIYDQQQKKIISQGFHKAFGQPHAEVEAILKLKGQKYNIDDLILVVNLEPCCHFGKTPPCVDLIINTGIKKVVIGTQDPNPLVAGKGIQKLQDNNISVILGVLEQQCKILNEIFFKNILKKQLFVAIKTATTLDGKIATKTGNSKWITCQKSRKFVQKLRNSYQAILTGSGSILKDNPNLNCRIKNYINPIRVILDTNLNTTPFYNVYKNDGTKVFVAYDKDRRYDDKIKLFQFNPNISFIKCNTIKHKIDLNDLFQKLYNLGIKSLLVEAGPILNQNILTEGLCDKIYHFFAPKLTCDNNSIPCVDGKNINNINEALNLHLLNVKKFDQDLLCIYYTNNCFSINL